MRVRYFDPSSRTVCEMDAVSSVGIWAVTPNLNGSGFCVTHAPTGCMMSFGQPEPHARQLAVALNRRWPDFMANADTATTASPGAHHPEAPFIRDFLGRFKYQLPAEVGAAAFAALALAVEAGDIETARRIVADAREDGWSP